MLVLWCALTWYISMQNFSREFDALVVAEQGNAEETSRSVADSIRRNLHFVAGIPDTFQDAIRVKKALAHFDKTTQPSTLAKPDAIKLWTADPDLQDMNKYLELIQRSLGIDLIFLVNATGDAVASSNWDKPGAPIGTNYADRKWFSDAQTWFRSMQYAVGKTTHIAGLYFTTPVVVDGRFKGAVVAKVDMPALAFLTHYEDAYVADSNGVIILAHDAEMVMMAIPGASVSRMSEQARLQLYARKEFAELKIKPWKNSARLKRINNENFPHLLASTALPEYDMTVYAESDLPGLPALEREQLNDFLLMSLLGGGSMLVGGILLFYIQSMRENKRMVEDREARLRLLLESVSGGIWGQSSAGLCTFINAAAAKMLGYQADELLGNSLHSLAHHSRPDGTDYAQTDCPMYATSIDGVSRTVKNEVLWRRDGSSFPVEYSTYPIYSEGELQGVVVVFSDISERRKLERRMQEREATYSAAIQTSVDGFWMTDLNGRILEVNDAYLSRSGYSRDELLNMSVSDLEADDTPTGIAAHIGIIIRSGCDEFEVNHIAKDGSSWNVAIAVSYADISGGRMFCFLKDVTDRKLYAQLLEASKEKADAANRAKSDFLANMSHEIRTPMNAVIGFSELALDEAESDQQRGYLHQIVESSRSLMGILNDILDFSKIEARQMSLDPGEFEIDELFGNLTRMLVSGAKDKGLELTFSRDADVPNQLIGDQLRLRQILTNLLGNALKFTKQGGVSVEVHRIDANETGVSLDFCVKDSGIGMTPEQLSSLFQPFVQADNSITRRFGGTGLGLTISRNLAQMMGGDIRVESVADVGSTFHFQVTLPVAEATQSAESTVDVNALAPLQNSAASLHGRRVLLAEDNRVNQLLASHMLKKFGMVLDIANNGEEAIRRLQEEHYDIVLMDIQMPVMDGLEATRIIRQDARFAKLPILAMSAGVTLDEQEKCASVGMTDFIGKPIDSQQLMNKLIELCG